MNRKAVFPGSFDPFTLGHLSIVNKAKNLFDEIIIGIGVNSTKNSFFTIEQRIKWIEDVFKNEPTIHVSSFQGLTIDFCEQNGCEYILRGLRNSRDFEYESAIANTNNALKPHIETVFLVCEPEHASINSSIVREVYKNGGDISRFLPSSMKLEVTK